jgi:hypothetical protein
MAAILGNQNGWASAAFVGFNRRPVRRCPNANRRSSLDALTFCQWSNEARMRADLSRRRATEVVTVWLTTITLADGATLMSSTPASR